ncbi:MAG: glycosyltransferase [Myxococcaceae bacterium]
MIDALLSAWAVAALLFTAVLLYRLTRRTAPGAAHFEHPEVLLLRPVDAPTAAELENLADVPPGVRQIVISPYRPALPRHIEWLPWDPIAPNRKASHLAAALMRYGPQKVVLTADADVRVTRELVEALLEKARGGAQLCTAPPSIEATGWGGLALSGILDHGPHSLTALDQMSIGPRAVCGKACALGPAAQELLPRLTRVVGEDLELSVRLHAAGHRVELASAPARVIPGVLPLRATVDRMTRWQQVLRAHRPALFPTVPLLIAPTLPLLAASVLAEAPFALALSAALVLARIAVSFALKRDRHASWSWALGEAVLLTGFARALVRRTVVWRGQRHRLAHGGTMQ